MSTTPSSASSASSSSGLPRFDLEAAINAVATVAARHAAEVDRGAFPTAALSAAREHRLLGLTSAIEVGGLGRGLAEAAAVVERLARECGSTAMVVCMHYAGAVVVEAHAGQDVRRAIAEGRHLTTLAFSEAGSRSHFWAPLGTAPVSAGRARLSSKKSWVTSAHHADSYVWSSKPSAGTELSSLWLMPRAAPGLRIGDGFDGLGLRGNDSCPVLAEAVELGEDARLGADGAGFGIMMGTVLPWFNVLNAACSAGMMESAVARTAAHAGATQFSHAGSAVADLPTVRAYIARMRIKTDQVKALLADTITAIAAGRPDTMLRVLESKACAGEAAGEVLDLAMRVCGGAAFRKEVGVERTFRDARAALVMGPTTDVLYDFIGKAVCGQPLF